MHITFTTNHLCLNMHYRSVHIKGITGDNDHSLTHGPEQQKGTRTIQNSRIWYVLYNFGWYQYLMRIYIDDKLD